MRLPATLPFTLGQTVDVVTVAVPARSRIIAVPSRTRRVTVGARIGVQQ